MNRFAIALCALLAGGCSPESADSPVIMSFEERLQAADTKIKALQDQAQELRAELHTAQISLGAIQIGKSLEKLAVLTPGADGYSLIKFDHGQLTVKLDDVAAYANGSKVKIRFGNMASADFQGVSGKIIWAETAKPGQDPITKDKKFTLSKDLKSGGWTIATFVLEEIPPASLDYIRLEELAASGIRLAAP